jgi:hypothetical protein
MLEDFPDSLVTRWAVVGYCPGFEFLLECTCRNKIQKGIVSFHKGQSINKILPMKICSGEPRNIFQIRKQAFFCRLG